MRLIRAHCACALENAPIIPELFPFLSVPYYSQKVLARCRVKVALRHTYVISAYMIAPRVRPVNLCDA